jgi:hypothetical protein
MLHKQIKDPVNRHAIDRKAIPQSFVYVTGRDWKVMFANNLQNTQAVSGDPKITGL